MVFSRVARYVLLVVPILAIVPIMVTTRADSSGPVIDWVVPQDYEGWLVIAWNCADGDPISTFNVPPDDDHYRIQLSSDGIACIADDFPARGYTLGTFTFPDGKEAPVHHGITRDATDTYYLSPGSPVPTPVTTNQVYSVASIGIGDEYALGDECDLRAFLHQHFGEPNSTVRCEPIYYRTPPDWYLATPRTG